MTEQNNKIRIKDIAILAGVSEGTVDRVLHDRGDVSEKSREAVKKVLTEINYSPNLFARSLASKKQYKFICLFPAHQTGSYWEKVDKGFDLAADDFSLHNVLIEKTYFDQYDSQSFRNASNIILLKEPDAVFIAPIFREEALRLTTELTRLHIPFSFIDSLIEEADYVTYYGQNSFQSGYIAAKLLLSSLPEGSQILVARTRRKGSVSNQTLARYNGFIQYIQEHHLNDQIELINVEFKNDDENANREILQNTFSTHSEIKAAITFNSKVYRLAMHLAELNHTNIRLIGYDLLEQNVTYLQQGVINYLIGQRPDKQAYFSIRDMCRQLIFRQEIKKINFVPIDILMKDNIEDYLNFTE
ncbi:MAG: substrate-binding domain-containing protein [Bacteroidota bacterium]|nr:substrate-binding domain-containing protein [Bacteroidota bacterium]